MSVLVVVRLLSQRAGVVCAVRSVSTTTATATTLLSVTASVGGGYATRPSVRPVACLLALALHLRLDYWCTLLPLLLLLLLA